MITKKIYLIRHGETDFNKIGKVQGCGIDASLNEKGRKQARLFYNMYKDIPFDKIYTSQLKRTMQTVAAFIKKGIPAEQYSGLNEINWGFYEGRVINGQEHQEYMALVDRWKEGFLNESILGGESPNDVAKRQKKVINHILSKKEEKNVLICMHGRALRIFLCQMLGKPLTQMDNFQHNNVGLYILNFNGEAIPGIEKNNCTLHLEQLLFESK